MKKSLVLLAFVPLSACISFGAKPPPSLLKLDAATPVPVGATQTSADAQTIAISVPAVPEELATQRVPVQASDTSIAYVKDAQWVEPPANLFARLDRRHDDRADGARRARRAAAVQPRCRHAADG